MTAVYAVQSPRHRGPSKKTHILAAALIALVASYNLDVRAETKPSAVAQPAAAKPAQIDRNGTLILIRTTLLALHQANETGNYTVLRDLAAPGFREANTAAKLGEIFASHRAQKFDLSGVAALDPQLTLLPQIESNGLLHMSGFFPSVPSQVNFELLFAAFEGRWRLFGIAVNVGSAAPAAPASLEVPQSAPPSANTRGETKRDANRASTMAPSKAGSSEKPTIPEARPEKLER